MYRRLRQRRFLYLSFLLIAFTLESAESGLKTSAYSIPQSPLKKRDSEYSPMEYISQVKDIRIIENHREFVNVNENDFWDELSDDQKDEIKVGIVELDKGQNLATRKWYPSTVSGNKVGIILD